ncbi:hypothetical protein V8C26DRAFT_206006 [Trichoderma gracile]
MRFIIPFVQPFSRKVALADPAFCVAIPLQPRFLCSGLLRIELNAPHLLCESPVATRCRSAPLVELVRSAQDFWGHCRCAIISFRLGVAFAVSQSQRNWEGVAHNPGPRYRPFRQVDMCFSTLMLHSKLRLPCDANGRWGYCSCESRHDITSDPFNAATVNNLEPATLCSVPCTMLEPTISHTRIPWRPPTASCHLEFQIYVEMSHSTIHHQ